MASTRSVWRFVNSKLIRRYSRITSSSFSVESFFPHFIAFLVAIGSTVVSFLAFGLLIRRRPQWRGMAIRRREHRGGRAHPARRRDRGVLVVPRVSLGGPPVVRPSAARGAADSRVAEYCGRPRQRAEIRTCVGLWDTHSGVAIPDRASSGFFPQPRKRASVRETSGLAGIRALKASV